MPLRFPHSRSAALLGLPLLAMALAGCPAQDVGTERGEKLDQIEQRLQQIEQRLASPGRIDPADSKGKPPAGVVKSLTFRMGSEDDRLRIYWADGTTSDLPCTREQGTWACG